MQLRIGTVTNVYESTGKVKVKYADTGNTSLPLSVLTTSKDYFLPSDGSMVVTAHMANGSSKGFVLGTFLSGCSDL